MSWIDQIELIIEKTINKIKFAGNEYHIIMIINQN